jgi:cell division protein ZapB
MISEFQDLSDKIDRLAQLTQSLRAENYLLRQANTLLSAENVSFKERLFVAQQRIQAMLDELPKPPGEEVKGNDADADAAVATSNPDSEAAR